MFEAILLVLGGFILLGGGGEGLVSGAVSLADRLKVPPLIIGLTVIAFGTSAPELTVSIQAAFQGQPDIAVESNKKEAQCDQQHKYAITTQLFTLYNNWLNQSRDAKNQQHVRNIAANNITH